MSDEQHGQGMNTDKELWRETPGDFYSPSLHVTAAGGIGINVGGFVAVMPLREWHKLARRVASLETTERILRQNIVVENPDAVNVLIDAMKQQKENYRALCQSLAAALEILREYDPIIDSQQEARIAKNINNILTAYRRAVGKETG